MSLNVLARSDTEASSMLTDRGIYFGCLPSFSGLRDIPTTVWPRLSNSTHKYEPPNPAGPTTPTRSDLFDAMILKSWVETAMCKQDVSLFALKFLKELPQHAVP
jgi:hypothetical protein